MGAVINLNSTTAFRDASDQFGFISEAIQRLHAATSAALRSNNVSGTLKSLIEIEKALLIISQREYLLTDAVIQKVLQEINKEIAQAEAQRSEEALREAAENCARCKDVFEHIASKHRDDRMKLYFLQKRALHLREIARRKLHKVTSMHSALKREQNKQVDAAKVAHIHDRKANLLESLAKKGKLPERYREQQHAGPHVAATGKNKNRPYFQATPADNREVKKAA
ncbi:TPA: hypothetical protein HA361_02870 [Candidatus Woesearchaeota archaeon]|nr:hypothetical protein [Candidatus Woesearchaeota archaeon]HII68677.1 hypothetical protein [Candidatus Woesearchaeota archaeon]